MSSITVEFEFEIGDLVYFKHAVHDETNKPRPLMICERIVQECPGGVQLQYKVLGDEYGTCLELTLTADEPEYRPYSDAKIDDMLKIADRKHEAERKRWDRDK